MPSFLRHPPLKPLVKWAGGKRLEIPVLRPLFPTTPSRVLEPFAGGAAVALELNAPCSEINDASPGLVAFYRALQAPHGRGAALDALRSAAASRVRASEAIDRLDDAGVTDVLGSPSAWAASQANDWARGWPPALAELLSVEVAASVAQKAGRRRTALEMRLGRALTGEELRAHLRTGTLAGIYTAWRRAYNGQLGADLPPAWQIAAWWLVRTLCYSGMFRYDQKGRFNVPYGGQDYDDRDLSPSIELLGSEAVASFFERARVSEGDFEAFLEGARPWGPADFVFVDPPYDSAFSQYGPDAPFDSAAQVRLAGALARVNAPWMLVVKRTPLMDELYAGLSLHRGAFSKRYQANFLNRHDRAVEHLVVTNYPWPPAVPPPLRRLP